VFPKTNYSDWKRQRLLTTKEEEEEEELVAGLFLRQSERPSKLYRRVILWPQPQRLVLLTLTFEK
jgi:hypothetical protein